MKVQSVNDEIWVHASTKQEWNDWLAINHETPAKVKLICYKKHTGKPSLTHRETMDEAICYGWIDTTLKRVDEDRYARGFAKRNKNSRWSDNTISYAKELIKSKRMQPAGLAAYQNGLKKPILGHGLGKNPEIPEELQLALNNNPKANAFFQTLAPSYRRYHIVMFHNAKRPETKEKRIKETIKKCELHQKI